MSILNYYKKNFNVNEPCFIQLIIPITKKYILVEKKNNNKFIKFVNLLPAILIPLSTFSIFDSNLDLIKVNCNYNQIILDNLKIKEENFLGNINYFTNYKKKLQYCFTYNLIYSYLSNYIHKINLFYLKIKKNNFLFFISQIISVALICNLNITRLICKCILNFIISNNVLNVSTMVGVIVALTPTKEIAVPTPKNLMLFD
jgi:hypothetical protein